MAELERCRSAYAGAMTDAARERAAHEKTKAEFAKTCGRLYAEAQAERARAEKLTRALKRVVAEAAEHDASCYHDKDEPFCECWVGTAEKALAATEPCRENPEKSTHAPDVSKKAGNVDMTEVKP
jgi:hypothetical protein